jgi:DNA helicase-2/ATP-dependent DNA helicase PcrA
MMVAHALHLQSLNEAQRRAVATGEALEGGRGFVSGPLLIIAGAGTGKTTTLAHRVAHLVLHGVDPARILLLTFSRRSAQEMRRRANDIVRRSLEMARGGGTAQSFVQRLGWAGTFHSVANRLLRHYAPQLGLDPSFTVIDRGDASDLLDSLREEQGLASRERRFPRKDTCLAIYSHRVNNGRPLAETLQAQYPWCAEWEEALTGLFRAYVARKQRDGILDYDDLLLYWNLLMAEPELARHVGAQFDHVLVDEYQDTNALQGGILQNLRPDGAGVTVVGDDAQSIYSFRAATVENILGFPERYTPPAAVVTLDENYRSVQPVLDAANALMAEAPRQHRKQLASVRAGGARPRLVAVDDLVGQAEYVCREVLARRETGVTLKRQAVLFRSASHSDLLEIELARHGIPFVKYGGLKFLEAAHVKDLLSVLRWADNARNTLAGFRVLQLLPGMGPANARRCLALQADAGGSWQSLGAFRPPPAAARDYLQLLELMAALAAPDCPWEGQLQRVREWYRPQLERLYEQAAVRGGDLEQLEQLATQYSSRERFISELALDPPQATSDLAGPPLRDEDYLVLSTIHSAKGMEWDSVYLLNVVDGSFPSEFATGRQDLLDEERRLLYVAMTRARDDLQLVHPLRFPVTQQAPRGDRHVYGGRSRFLTHGVMQHLEQAAWHRAPVDAQLARAASLPRVDVAAKLRDLF